MKGGPGKILKSKSNCNGIEVSHDQCATLDWISTVTTFKVVLLDVLVERNLISLTEGAPRLMGQYCFFLLIENKFRQCQRNLPSWACSSADQPPSFLLLPLSPDFCPLNSSQPSCKVFIVERACLMKTLLLPSAPLFKTHLLTLCYVR